MFNKFSFRNKEHNFKKYDKITLIVASVNLLRIVQMYTRMKEQVVLTH